MSTSRIGDSGVPYHDDWSSAPASPGPSPATPAKPAAALGLTRNLMQASPFPAYESPSQVMGDAAEELTFMFSEKSERAKRAFEAQVDRALDTEFDDIPIERVHAVVRMLEGSKAYAQVRTMARQFVLAYERGEPEPENFLRLHNLRPEMRYAALRQVLDTLASQGQEVPTALRAEHRALIDSHGDDLNGLFGAVLPTPAAAGRAVPPPGGTQSLSEAAVLSVLALRPTARAVFDAASGLDAPQQLGNSLHGFQLASTQLLRRAENLATLVIVNRLIGTVRSMVFFAAELEGRRSSRDPSRDGDDEDKRRRNRHLHVRLLLDIANASLPSGLVDKLMASLHPKGVPAASPQRPVFLSALHRQIGQWPDAVFPGPESRHAVREQVLRLQPVTRPGMSVR